MDRRLDKWGRVLFNSVVVVVVVLIAGAVCHRMCVWDVNTRRSDDKIACG